MSVVDTAKTIGELIKKGATIELQETVMQLRGEAVDLQDEDYRLKQENLELKKQIDLQETVRFRRRVYWRDGDEIPFCQYCREESQLLIHLAGGQGTDDHAKRHYRCPECRTIYTALGDEDFVMDTFRGDHLRGRKK